jgi:sphingomyelin phosphodiesterase
MLSWQDEFAIAYSDYSQQTAANAVSVGWIAPALTPRGTAILDDDHVYV